MVTLWVTGDRQQGQRLAPEEERRENIRKFRDQRSRQTKGI